MLIEPTIKQVNNRKFIDGVMIDEFIKNNEVPAIIFNGSRVKQLSLYLLETIKKSYSNSEIHYAVKACYTPSIIKILKENDMKFEIMSEFEYRLLKRIGIKGKDLIFNGPGKTNKMLELAITEGVELINVDSEAELEQIVKIAQRYNKIVKIGLRIQPEVPQESFLKRGEKLGIDQKNGQAERIVAKAINSKYVDLCGIHFHSFINQNHGNNIVSAFIEVIKFLNEMNNKYKFKPSYIDIGGGLATIDNWKEKEFEKFALEVGNIMKQFDWNPKLIIEPGRFLVSDCAIVIAKIIRKKVNGNSKWIIVNANSNILIPLATADFRVESVKYEKTKLIKYNVGDCLCSASGTIQRDVLLPENLSEGDYLIIKNAGAYTINLSEPFAEPIMPIYLTDNENYELVHKGVNIEEMIEYFFKKG